MSTAQQVVRGTVRLLSGQLAARAFHFALYLLLARRLGVESFGLYTYAASFTMLFNVVADLGVTTVFTREAARHPTRTQALLSDSLAIKIILSAVTLLVVLGVALVTDTPMSTVALIAVFTAGMLLQSLAGVFEGLLRVAGRAGAAGMSLALTSAVGLVTAAALVLGGSGVMGAMIAHVAAQSVHLVVAAWLARDLSPGSDARSSTQRVRMRVAVLRESLPLAASWIFIALYFRIDSVMLHAMQGESAVGFYGGIYRVFELFTMVAVASRLVLFPVMSRIADGPVEHLATLCRKVLRLHLLFTIPVALFISFQAHVIVALVLGEDYAAAAPGLAILIWALPGSFMADTLLHLLVAQRRQALGTWAVGATALLNVGLNFILIAPFSFVGASAATVASEATSFTLLFILFRRTVPGIGIVRAAVRPLAASAILGAAFAWGSPHLPGGLAGLAVALPGALAAYGVGLALVGAIDRADLALARDLVPSILRGRAEESRP